MPLSRTTLFILALVALAITATGALAYKQLIINSTNTIDFEVELITEEGSRPFRISELRGKIVILEFTYVGCAGCEYLHKLGYVQEVYDMYKDEIEIVTVFLYYPYDDLDYIRKYKENFRINWDYLAVDRDGDLIVKLKLSALFTHIFLDEEGVERFRKIGHILTTKELFPTVIEMMQRKEYEKLREMSDPI